MSRVPATLATNAPRRRGTCWLTSKPRAGRRCCARRSGSPSAHGPSRSSRRVSSSARRAYGEVRLHRPLGDQLQMFIQHLPGQRTSTAGYDDVFTAEQIAAMMPTAHPCRRARAAAITSGTRSPGHGDRSSSTCARGPTTTRNTTILSVGALGSGKTTLAQKLQYEGFLQGARVIDCDPKGDHRFHLLEDVAPHVEALALRPDRALRGDARPAARRAGAHAPGGDGLVSARPAASDAPRQPGRRRSSRRSTG